MPHPTRPRRYKRTATRERASPSGTCSAAGHNPASVPSGWRSQRAPPTFAQNAEEPRSRKTLRARNATATVSSRLTRIATPNGSERHMLPVIRISRNRAGRIAPSRCQDAAMKPPNPNSTGATQLLKSSASGAPRHTRGVAIATNAKVDVQKMARPRRAPGSSPAISSLGTRSGSVIFVPAAHADRSRSVRMPGARRSTMSVPHEPSRRQAEGDAVLRVDRSTPEPLVR